MACFIVPNPTFKPQVHLISAITNAIIPTVTTISDHNYPVNIWVRFYIPREYGMTEIDGQMGFIAPISPTQFIVAFLDTLAFNAFVVPGSALQCAQVVPIGEHASTLAGAVRNVL